jgi:short-subunit dehydrogenase
MDLSAYGVGVTVINPGWVRTPMTERSSKSLPNVIGADDAARRIVDGMLRGKREIHFPKQVTWYWKLITALPRPLYEAVASYHDRAQQRKRGD